MSTEVNGTKEIEPDMEEKFTIANIRQSIQQRLRGSKSKESDNSAVSVDSSGVSQCGGLSSSSQQTIAVTPVPVVDLVESGKHRSCTEVAAVLISEANEIAIKGLHCENDHGSILESAPCKDSCSDSSLLPALAPEVCSEDAVGGQGGIAEMDPSADCEGCADCSEQWKCLGHKEQKSREVCSENEHLTQSPASIAEHTTTVDTDQRQHIVTDQCEASLALQHGSQMQNVHTLIKHEKEDPGYELHSGVSHSSCQAQIDLQVVKEEQPFQSEGCPGPGKDGDVVIHCVSYRVPDDSDDESDSKSDTSSLSSFEVKAEEPEHGSAQVIPRSKGEVLPEELPPLENLHISLPEKTRLELLGVVTGIVGVLVVIESTVDLEKYSPVNDDTVLFYENRQPFGVVFEVFGPCKAPSYCVRFNSVADIKEKGIEIGLRIYFVPEPVPEVGEITHFVFVNKLKRFKGSDASWKGNNEPPDEMVDYSDDEEEKHIKAKRRAERTGGRAQGRTADRNNSVNGEDWNQGKGPPTKKKHMDITQGSCSSQSTYNRTDSRSWPANQSGGQQSFSTGRGAGHCIPRRDFHMVRPSNFSGDPNGSQMFFPRNRGPESSWGRGPFSSRPRNGTYDSGCDPSGDRQNAGDTGRPPFLGSPHSQHGIRRPYQASFPASSTSPAAHFSDRRGINQQGSVPPPPPTPPPPHVPQWTSFSQPPPPVCSPQFSPSHSLDQFSHPPPGFGTGPPQPGFGFTPPGSSFGTGIQQWHFGTSQAPPKFQDEPQFVRYHQYQN